MTWWHLAGPSEARTWLILGRQHAVEDALAAYAGRLAAALADAGMPTAVGRAWPASELLTSHAPDWQGRRVLLQYTAGQWHPRAIPWRLPGVLVGLRQRGAVPGVVFHDADGYIGGRRPFAGLRLACQRGLMRRLVALSAVAITTTPAETTLGWWPAGRPECWISVGSNLHPPGAPVPAWTGLSGRRIVVFCLSEGPVGEQELARVETLLAGCGRADWTLDMFGRGIAGREGAIRTMVRRLGGRLTLADTLSAEAAAARLARARVALFVRGRATSNRSALIAPLVAGVPVVGPVTEVDPPLDDAGLALLPDVPAAAAELARLLSDDAAAAAAAGRSRAVAEAWFAWPAVARRVTEALAAA